MATLVIIRLEDKDDALKTSNGWYFPIVEVKVMDKDGNEIEHGTLRTLHKVQMEELLRLNPAFRKRAWLKTVLHVIFNH